MLQKSKSQQNTSPLCGRGRRVAAGEGDFSNKILDSLDLIYKTSIICFSPLTRLSGDLSHKGRGENSKL